MVHTPFDECCPTAIIIAQNLPQRWRIRRDPLLNPLLEILNHRNDLKFRLQGVSLAVGPVNLSFNDGHLEPLAATPVSLPLLQNLGGDRDIYDREIGSE